MKTDQSILFANYTGYKYLTKLGEIQLSNISLSFSCKVVIFFFFNKNQVCLPSPVTLSLNGGGVKL